MEGLNCLYRTFQDLPVQFYILRFLGTGEDGVTTTHPFSSVTRTELCLREKRKTGQRKGILIPLEHEYVHL